MNSSAPQPIALSEETIRRLVRDELRAILKEPTNSRYIGEFEWRVREAMREAISTAEPQDESHE